MGTIVDILFALRKRLRRWLGIAAIQRQVRDLEVAQKNLEAGMVVRSDGPEQERPAK